MDIWPTFRQQFPVTEKVTYLNHAAVSPLPLRCKDRMQEYLEEVTRFGAHHHMERVPATLTLARSLGARLLGTAADRVFFVRSTTQGIGLAATGLPFASGDNVVLARREFPANLRPWMPLRRRGVEVRLVEPREGRVLLDDVAAAVDDRTVAVSLSFVQFLSGFRLDVGSVAQICRQHDALMVVDGIQGVGAFPLNVEAAGVDLLSADAHKWMLGPEGVGLGYASPRALERIQPALEGWLSVERPFDFFDLEQPLKPTAARFEEGAYNLAGINGLIGCLELLLEVGTEAMAARILELTDFLTEALRSRDWSVLSPREHAGEKSGIVLAEKEGVDTDLLAALLHKAGIVVSIRGGALRVSPHGYNNREDLGKLLEYL